MTETERHAYDVVVIGAGGAGLRAAIEARAQGKRTAVICKSLFGKAHTVMAEGGIAASMGNVNCDDNWQVHFRDTMRGGKFLNHWRMAELHAKEAPDRVWELETWGALFDRTKDGRISQRNFGGHEYPRLAHVGDRTGLELIRTLQQKIVSLQQEDERELGDPEARIKVFAECTITRLLTRRRPHRRRVRLLARVRPLRRLRRAGRRARDRRHRQVVQGDEQLLGVHRRRARAGPAGRRRRWSTWSSSSSTPPGMVWPPSVKGILVTESVRGDGGVLTNSEGKRFMFDYVPDVFRSQVRRVRGRGRPLVRRPVEQPPPARAAPPRRGGPRHQRRGQGGPRLAARRRVPRRQSKRLPADVIRRKLPSMHHQFKELADVDITAEPMEVGPTCHYVMGGVEVDPDTAASDRPGAVRGR